MSTSQLVCTVCGGAGHKMSKCKELGLPPEGFFKPSGGGHCHDEDCEDEALRIELMNLAFTLIKNKSHYRPAKRLF